MSQVEVKDTNQVKQMVDQWVAALLDGDVQRLRRMTTDNFVTIGPLGFVLSKEQWLGSFNSGDLRYKTLKWDEISVSSYEDAAIVVGRDRHTVNFQNQDTTFDLRGQLVLVKQRGDWKFASQQYSAINPPPGQPRR